MAPAAALEQFEGATSNHHVYFGFSVKQNVSRNPLHRCGGLTLLCYCLFSHDRSPLTSLQEVQSTSEGVDSTAYSGDSGVRKSPSGFAIGLTLPPIQAGPGNLRVR